MGLFFSLFDFELLYQQKKLREGIAQLQNSLCVIFWIFYHNVVSRVFCFPNLDNDNEDDDEEEDDTGNWKRQKKTEYPVAYDF